MHTALLLAFSVLVHASSWHPPASTISLYDKADPAGWMPAHTAAPEAFELVKRQSTNFGPVCGYLEGSKCKLSLVHMLPLFHISSCLIMLCQPKKYTAPTHTAPSIVT